MAELLCIQPNCPANCLRLSWLNAPSIFTILVLIQKIVILPKRILLGSTLACFCCPLRFRSQKGKMNIGKADLATLDIQFLRSDAPRQWRIARSTVTGNRQTRSTSPGRPESPVKCRAWDTRYVINSSFPARPVPIAARQSFGGTVTCSSVPPIKGRP